MKYTAIATIQQMDAEITKQLEDNLKHAGITMEKWHHEGVYEVGTKDIDRFNKIHSAVVKSVMHNHANLTSAVKCTETV